MSLHVATLLVMAVLCAGTAQGEPWSIETTLVDDDALSGATFQSHNQKVVQNDRGIFMTHVRSRNEEYTAQKWRLSWSRDGGRTFATLFEATQPTNPAVLETDAAGHVYLGRPDFVTREIYLDRFLRSEDYRQPHTTSVPDGAGGKYAMALDAAREQLYFLSHTGMFIRFGLDGELRSAEKIIAKGQSAVCEYPSLQVDGDGTLHAAWTTYNTEQRVYWSIHYLRSPDGGKAWQTMSGMSVELPIVADETGPADRISLDDEFEVSSWLSNFHVKDGKAHFLYLARTTPPRQHYVRYDLRTGQRERDTQPEFRGEQLAIRHLDGFFASDTRKPGGPLFCVACDERLPRLVCLVSHDQGDSWQDQAVGAPLDALYAIGGCREVTPDGFIIGSFTQVVQRDGQPAGRVHFFRIPVAEK